MSKIVKTVKKLKINKILFVICLFLSNVSFCTYYYLKNYLGDVSFFQLYYHIVTSSADSGSISVVLSAFLSCIPLILLLIIIEIFIFTRWKKYRVYFKSNKNKKEYNIFPTIFSKYKLISSTLLLLVSVSILLNYLRISEYLNNKNTSTDLYEKYYIDTNKVDITFNGKKRNLIYIYLESMESSLFSKKNNGAFEKSRIPELEKLAEKNINFSHNNGLGGMYDASNYTIAALVSSTSGTPITASCENECQKYGDIIPKVKTIGDTLTKEGYNVLYMQGTDSNFSGFKQYLTKHSNQKIIDYV